MLYMFTASAAVCSRPPAHPGEAFVLLCSQKDGYAVAFSNHLFAPLEKSKRREAAEQLTCLCQRGTGPGFL